MPEGHTIHRIARDLQPLTGLPVRATSPQGRFADGAAAVSGQVLARPDAHGKHLLLRFAFGDVVHVHLGMQGKVLAAAGDPRRQVRLRLDGGPGLVWDLIAPSTCELLHADHAAALVARLGPDPLRPDADPGVAFANVTSHRGTLGAALLDQSVLSGVGNVLRAEALAAVGLHPSMPAASLDSARWDRLWATLVAMMEAAVETGEIEGAGRRVYEQERCAACGGAVESFDLSGRTAYACPSCQVAA